MDHGQDQEEDEWKALVGKNDRKFYDRLYT